MQPSVSDYLSISAIAVSVFALILNLENRGASATLDDVTPDRFIWRSAGPTPIRRFQFRTLEPVHPNHLWPSGWTKLGGPYATGELFVGTYPAGAGSGPHSVEVRYARSRYVPFPMKRQVFEMR